MKLVMISAEKLLRKQRKQRKRNPVVVKRSNTGQYLGGSKRRPRQAGGGAAILRATRSTPGGLPPHFLFYGGIAKRGRANVPRWRALQGAGGLWIAAGG